MSGGGREYSPTSTTLNDPTISIDGSVPTLYRGSQHEMTVCIRIRETSVRVFLTLGDIVRDRGLLQETRLTD